MILGTCAHIYLIGCDSDIPDFTYLFAEAIEERRGDPGDGEDKVAGDNRVRDTIIASVTGMSTPASRTPDKTQKARQTPTDGETPIPIPRLLFIPHIMTFN